MPNGQESYQMPSETQIDRLLATGPSTLTRKETAVVTRLADELCPSAKTDSARDFLTNLSQAASNNRIQIIAISAFDVLKHALLTPKGVADIDGIWFTKFPLKLMEYIAQQRW